MGAGCLFECPLTPCETSNCRIGKALIGYGKVGRRVGAFSCGRVIKLAGSPWRIAFVGFSGVLDSN
jgi:hypothetical protein